MSLRAIQVFDGEGIAPPPAPKPERKQVRFTHGHINVDDIGYKLIPAPEGDVVIRQTFGGRWIPGKLGCWSFKPSMHQSVVTVWCDSNGGQEFFFTRETLRAFIRAHCK